MFDNYSRAWPEVFVSEYAAQCPPAAHDQHPACVSGTLFNAVMEGAWMVRGRRFRIRASALKLSGFSVEAGAVGKLLVVPAWALPVPVSDRA
jgi:hypothetical protein